MLSLCHTVPNARCCVCSSQHIVSQNVCPCVLDMTLQGYDVCCVSGQYLYKPFFQVESESGLLVCLQPKATAAVHVPALDVVQLVLGMILELISLAKNVPSSIVPSALNDPATIQQFETVCRTVNSQLLQILRRDPAFMATAAYGCNLAAFKQWGPVLGSMFDTCPDLARILESILQPSDLSQVPSVDDLLASPLLAPCAERAQQQHVMLGAQQEANIKAAYECGLKVAALFDSISR